MQAQRSGAELHQLGHAAGLHVLMRREQILHGLGADRPFQRTVDVGIEFFRGEARALVQRQMQAEQAPFRVLEVVELFQEGGRQLLAADQRFECLMHVERGGDELPRAHRAAVVERDAGRLAVLDRRSCRCGPAADKLPPAAMKASINPRARLNEPPWQSW